jgi:chromosome segregation ATPase
VAKLKAAAASAGTDQSASSKKLELCEEKIASLEGEISRVKQLMRARENELEAAKEEARASERRAAAAQGKEDDEVRAKDVLALRGDLAAAQAAAAAAAAERDSVLKREADLLQQFEELKRAFHSATEGAAAAAVAPEVVEKLKKDAEAARLSEMATRGELCLMKEQLEGLELKHHTLQTQMQAEKQRGERLRREKEDLELANSCMKGEMSTMKRVSVNQDRLVRVPVAGLARVPAFSLDAFCPATRLCWPTSCAA